MNRKHPGVALGQAVAFAMTAAVSAEEDTLQRPADVGELVFLSSGHGMAFGAAAEKAKQAGALPPFTNMFVTPQAYRSFMRSGKWPDGATFFLEVRAGVGHTANGVSGSSQGHLLALQTSDHQSASAAASLMAWWALALSGTETTMRMLG